MPNDLESLRPSSETALVPDNGNRNVNDRLTKKQLVSLLQTGKPLDLKGRYVSDDVNLTGISFGRPIKVQNLVCTAEVNFNGARFQRGVDFTGCSFQKLNLTDARVEGGLILDKVIIGSEADHKLRRKNRPRKGETQISPPVVADFTNLRVAGCFSMMNATVYGGLSCTQADIEDDFRIDEAQIYGDLRLRRAHFGEFCTDAKQRTVSAGATDEGPQKLTMRCGIDGKLDLTSARVDGDVRLIGVFVGGELSLQTADINGNFLCRARKNVRTVLNYRAWLLGARVAGVVDFTACVVRGRVVFDDAKIGNRVDFNRSRLNGDVGLNNAQVANNASFFACHVRGNLTLDGAKIGNNLSLDGALVKGNLHLQNASIGNTIFLRTTKVESTTKSPPETLRCQITGTAWLLGATAMGDIDISGVRIGNGLMMQNVNIGQNLMAVIMDGFQTHIGGDTHLNGVRIRGGAEFGGAVLGGDLDLDGASIEGGFMASIYLNDTADWRIERTRCGGRIHAKSATIGKQVLLTGLTARAIQFSVGDLKDPRALALKLRDGHDPVSEYLNERLTPATQEQLKQYDASTFPAESLRNALVDDINEVLEDSSLFDEQRFDGITLSAVTSKLIKQRPPKDLAHFNRLLLEDAYPREIGKKEKGVDFSGAHLNGEFSLYSKESVKELLQAKKAGLQPKGVSGEREQQLLAQGSLEFTEIEGDLRLTRTHVLGDITLDGVTINGKLDMRDANIRANINCRPIKSDNGNPARASVMCADFETLEMIGDMDLTGLDIDGERKDGNGDLILADTRIRGRLELCPRHQVRNEDQITRISGALRLNAAEISHAILTGVNLVGADNRGSTPTLWEQIQTARRDGDSAIMYLLRGGPKEKEIQARVEFERAIIGRLQIFEPFPGTLDLSNLKVESWDWLKDRPRYFNEMLTKSHPFKKSNYLAIEKALRNRGEDEQADEVHVLMRQRDRRQTKGVLRVLFDRLLDHSIKYGTTSTRLSWFMLGWFVASVFIFSSANRVEYDFSPDVGKPITITHPDPWSTKDAAFIAARLHVPIISLGVEDKIVPSGARMKAYAILVVAASWLMWPLLIASVSGLIRKRE